MLKLADFYAARTLAYARAHREHARADAGSIDILFLKLLVLGRASYLIWNSSYEYFGV